MPSKQWEVLGIDSGDKVEVFISDGQLLPWTLGAIRAWF